jgi:hypothetical protein
VDYYTRGDEHCVRLIAYLPSAHTANRRVGIHVETVERAVHTEGNEHRGKHIGEEALPNLERGYKHRELRA